MRHSRLELETAKTYVDYKLNKADVCKINYYNLAHAIFESDWFAGIDDLQIKAPKMAPLFDKHGIPDKPVVEFSVFYDPDCGGYVDTTMLEFIAKELCYMTEMNVQVARKPGMYGPLTVDLKSQKGKPAFAFIYLEAINE